MLAISEVDPLVFLETAKQASVGRESVPLSITAICGVMDEQLVVGVVLGHQEGSDVGAAQVDTP